MSAYQMPNVEALKAQTMDQYERIMQIPGRVLNNWPAFFGYAVVDYLSTLVIQMIPVTVPGVPGNNIVNSVYQSGVRGGVKVLDQVTWDTLKKY